MRRIRIKKEEYKEEQVIEQASPVSEKVEIGADSARSGWGAVVAEAMRMAPAPERVGSFIGVVPPSINAAPQGDTAAMEITRIHIERDIRSRSYVFAARVRIGKGMNRRVQDAIITLPDSDYEMQRIARWDRGTDTVPVLVGERMVDYLRPLLVELLAREIASCMTSSMTVT